MAYVDQTKKAKIAAALKLVIPKSWRYSLAVQHHSTLVLTIKSAPIDLIDAIANKCDSWNNRSHTSLNHYYLDRTYSGELLATFEAIKDAMNTDNHDRSDSQSDYFDVGHYISINVGKWDKPFIVK